MKEIKFVKKFKKRLATNETYATFEINSHFIKILRVILIKL